MAATIAVVYPHMNAIGGDGFWLVREPGGRVRAIEACGPAGTPRHDRALPRQGLRRDPGARARRGPDGRRRGRRLAGRARARAARSAARLPLADAPRRRRPPRPRGLPGLGLGGRAASRTSPRRCSAAPGFAETFLVEGKTPAAGTMPQAAGARRHAGAARRRRARRFLPRRRRARDRRRPRARSAARSRARDLEALPGPPGRAALGEARGTRRVYNFPPPTQGLASLLILGILERLGVAARETVEHHHGLIEAAKRAFAIRDRVVHRSRPAAARSVAISSGPRCSSARRR